MDSHFSQVYGTDCLEQIESSHIRKKIQEMTKCGFYNGPTHVWSPKTTPKLVLVSFNHHQMHDMVQGSIQRPKFVGDWKFSIAI
jgi:hypothetical protein